MEILPLNEYTYACLLREIRDRTGKNSPLFAAIDGRCGSGKSTLGQRMADDLSGVLLHMDDFYLRKEQRTPERYAEPGGNVDRERVAALLETLKDGKGGYFRKTMHPNFDLGPENTVPASDIYIVEGSYSMHPELRRFYGISVFLTLPENVQRERLMKRNPDQMDMFIGKWIPLEEKYFSGLHVIEHCDRIFDTSL